MTTRSLGKAGMGTWAHPKISKSWGSGDRVLEGWIRRFLERVQETMPRPQVGVELGSPQPPAPPMSRSICLRVWWDGRMDLV